MKKYILRSALAAWLLSTALSASVTLNFEGGVLFGTDTDSPLADSALIYAIARPSGTAFAGPTAGSFTGAGELFLGKWNPDSSGMGEAGAFSAVISDLSLTGGLQTGMDVWIVWFPELTTASLSPAPGFVYGAFHKAGWTLPANSSTASYGLETAAVGGELPDADFIADKQVSAVPEPGFYAVFAGATVLGLACGRNQRRRPSIA